MGNNQDNPYKQKTPV